MSRYHKILSSACNKVIRKCGCRIFIEAFGVLVVGKLDQGWMEWLQVIYDHRFHMFSQFMWVGWLVAEQGCVGQVCNCLHRRAEYWGVVFPSNGEGERYCYQILSIYGCGIN